ncbi:MAG: hypothetical protein DHS20C16_17580 [Phycisphaerae bacterium]|nr:MAG: hypothetical protein DHS20C16_17580 [Phycisphaerae bacterium]
MQVSANRQRKSVPKAVLSGIAPAVDASAARIKRSLSARGRRVALFVIAICVINLFDLVLTIRAHRDGVLHEENPIARSILEIGPMALLVFKMSVIAGAGYVLFSFRRHRCAELACLVVLAAYVGVAVRWRICYAFYDMSTVAWQDNVTYDMFDPVSVLLNCL